MDDADIDAIISQCSLANIYEAIPATGLLQASSHNDFCLAFARRVAGRYFVGALSFSEADKAMNWLYAVSYVTESSLGMPDLALEIFDAFDSGEYCHSGDAPDVNPELKYTVPRIKEIVESFD